MPIEFDAEAAAVDDTLHSSRAVQSLTRDLLSFEAGLATEQDIGFKYSGEVRVYEDSSTRNVTIFVPVPHLYVADCTTDELEETLQPLMPDGVGLSVSEAQPPTKTDVSQET